MRNRFLSLSFAVAGIFLLAAQPSVSFAGNSTSDTELTPEKLIAEHVKSIGGPSLLASVQTRAFVGTTDVRFIQGMTGSIQGGLSTMVSEGNKLSFILKYDSVDYPQEYFSYNGNEVSVGHIAPGQRSPLADFLFRYNGIMKKGFLGGTLTMAWPLLNPGKEESKLKLKKSTVDGQELYELEWPRSILGNVRIRMYFEPDTFHHVRTEYDIRIQGDVSVQSQDQYIGDMGTVDEDTGEIGYSSLMRKDLVPDSIYKLIEKFGDYKKVSGLTLPYKYSIEYSIEGQGHSFIGNWTIKPRKFTFNKKYDEKIFEAQK